MKALVISPSRLAGAMIHIGADSAILRVGEPVFVPEPADQWLTAVVPAIRISRLGTAIKVSRARGYYDAITAVHLLYKADGVLPPFVLDRAIAPGRWLEIGADDDTFVLSVARGPIKDAASPLGSHRFTLADLALDATISSLSRSLTFRTGDMLVFPDAGVSPGAPVLDTEVHATLSASGHHAEEVLDIRIK